ncbi:MAG: OmpH family outer membrane protein [Thermodesulfobacteriota bacterium]
MKAKMMTAALVLLLALFFSGAAMAQETGKIGILDVQRVLNASAAGKEATASLTAKGTAAQKDLLKRNDEIEELKKTLERKMLVMNPESRDEKQKELRNKILDLKDLEKKYQDDLRSMEQDLREGIMNQIMALVASIGKKEGYVLIIDKNEGGVVYAPDAIDLTDRVIQEFNADYQKSKGKKN